MYKFGLGVTQDDAVAVSWYKKSANHGDARGECDLAFAYQEGEGVPQDYVQAMRWYRKSAEQGFGASMWNLGTLYSAGWGTPQNFVEAYFWYDLAVSVKIENLATKDRIKLSDDRDQAASHLSSTALVQTQERAKKWFDTHIAIADQDSR
jgi:TPR repeat protein